MREELREKMEFSLFLDKPRPPPLSKNDNHNYTFLES